MIAWEPARYPFGEGLYTVVVGVCWELIPYVGEDGLGQVAGFAVRADRGLALTRVPGSIELARAEAERRIGGGNGPVDC